MGRDFAMWAFRIAIIGIVLILWLKPDGSMLTASMIVFALAYLVGQFVDELNDYGK